MFASGMMKTLKHTMMKENCKTNGYEQNHEPLTTLMHREKYGPERKGVKLDSNEQVKSTTKTRYKQKKAGR